MSATILRSNARVRRDADTGVCFVSDGIMPTIQKASRIIGNHLVLRNAICGRCRVHIAATHRSEQATIPIHHQS
jgi:hypothetical protein